MTTLHIPIFETERLTLREPRMTDMDAFATFMASPRAQYVSVPDISYRDAARAFGHMAGLWLLRGYGPHVWCLKDGTPIGHGGPWFPKVWPEPELGWCLWAGHHEGKGYVTEAMTVLRNWAFEGLHLPTVVAYIDPANTASIKVATWLGGVVDPDAKSVDNEPDMIFRFHPRGAL